MPRQFLIASVTLLVISTIAMAQAESDLLRRFQAENQAAGQKLKNEAERVLSQSADAASVRKVLAQLEADILLPRAERTLLMRKLEQRLRETTPSEAPPPADAEVRKPKISVKQQVAVSPGRIRIATTGGTVVVPDGGSADLGGFRYLAESRNEYGVPGLGGIPYLGRLFRSVGYSRFSGSMNISVTGRIIILEEEEAQLLGR